MTPPRRATLADVARLAGLSKTAVSLILNDRPGSRLSDEAAERARAAAAQLGYKPNPAAQSLRSGKTRTIGFISDQVTITRFASAMVRGTLRAAKEYDHTVLIAETGDDVSQLAAAFDEMIDRRVDGVIVGLMAARMVDVPSAPHGVPVVIVNGRTPDDLPSVLPDEYAAGRAMASVLMDAGHTRIGFIADIPQIAGDPRRSVTIARRLAGIREALAERGATSFEAVGENWTTALGFAETTRLLADHPEITAFIAGTDGVAFGVYQALSDLGLHVPRDISVVSFDDEELASLVRPGLTTARLPYEQMARHGVEMLLGDRELAHELLPMPVIARDSVRTLIAEPTGR
ncbi:MAG TPA: LacI family DNA-binding transcriptional regulator [Microbacterium sp.]|uniref:LacI family DNA-binding transcriptional regulator n=1 Tax=Microbacterium sp. TaxID=51671 RepID=UPI002B461495|nr:LacI family DNA-binding transcriptional regulator [Microbacterium sp.]HKT55456.1 LacI family DNA-binding transcriptional regulator [Microbacterium sp.]